MNQEIPGFKSDIDQPSPIVEEILDHISPRAIERARVIAERQGKARRQRMQHMLSQQELDIYCRLAERGSIEPIIDEQKML